MPRNACKDQVDQLPPRLVSGAKRIRRLDPSLLELASAHRQVDDKELQDYFLEKPGLLRRIPTLLAFKAASAHREAVRGAVMTHQFRPFGIASGLFGSADRSGRSAVLGPPQNRLQIALAAGLELMGSGALSVQLSVEGTAVHEVLGECVSKLRGAYLVVRSRSYPSYLQLCQTYDATLATVGQKTRANLRYYRRRAEAELHCRFLPEVEITREQLSAFNQACSFPVSEQTIAWRYTAQQMLRSVYLMGMQDGEGRWLSVIAGRRFGETSEILWQMNRRNLPRHSIVSVMRSYHLEHEIQGGMRRYAIEGGTTHSLEHSFQTTAVTDVVLVRKSFRGGLLAFLKRYAQADNPLAEVLLDPRSIWHNG